MYFSSLLSVGLLVGAVLLIALILLIAGLVLLFVLGVHTAAIGLAVLIGRAIGLFILHCVHLLRLRQKKYSTVPLRLYHLVIAKTSMIPQNFH